MSETALRRTPLSAAHERLKARMVPFAGWLMPVQYTGILEEARAVRTASGMFDISHMGRCMVHGPGAADLLQRLTTNDVSALEVGQAHYSLITNEAGGILDDIIIYRTSADAFRVVLNASNTERDLAWFRQACGSDAAVEDQTAETAMIAVQGPDAVGMVAFLCRANVETVPRFAWTEAVVAGCPATLCRTGYTGEDGFEIILAAETAESVWQALLQAGCTPCGLGARDTLRVEAGYPLYGHEIDEHTSPVEAGLLWAVKLEKGDFTGREAILRVKEQGPTRRLAGLVLADRVAPRQGYTLHDADSQVGIVTSGAFSPIRGCGIGMAYLAPPYHRPSTQVEVDIRGKRHAAVVVSKKDLLLRS